MGVSITNEISVKLHESALLCSFIFKLIASTWRCYWSRFKGLTDRRMFILFQVLRAAEE